MYRSRVLPGYNPAEDSSEDEYYQVRGIPAPPRDRHGRRSRYSRSLNPARAFDEMNSRAEAEYYGEEMLPDQNSGNYDSGLPRFRNPPRRRDHALDRRGGYGAFQDEIGARAGYEENSEEMGRNIVYYEDVEMTMEEFELVNEELTRREREQGMSFRGHGVNSSHHRRGREQIEEVLMQIRSQRGMGSGRRQPSGRRQEGGYGPRRQGGGYGGRRPQY